MTPTTHKVAILIFDGVDLLDVGGPYEVFLTASRLAAREGRIPPFEVTTVSVDGRQRTAYGGSVSSRSGASRTRYATSSLFPD